MAGTQASIPSQQDIIYKSILICLQIHKVRKKSRHFFVYML